MADTGATLAGTVATASVAPEDDDDWNTPDNIKADDENNSWTLYATADKYSYQLKATNFGFSVPAGTINGIVVTVDRKTNYADGAVDYRVQLIDDNGSLVGDNKADTETAYPTTHADATYGANNDTWSATPTPSMVNNSNFGVCFSCKSLKGILAYVYDIQMTIYYTESGGSGFTKVYIGGASNTIIKTTDTNTMMVE